MEVINELYYLNLDPYSKYLTKKKQLTLDLVKNKRLVNLMEKVRDNKRIASFIFTNERALSISLN
jgi:hypothetical protein